MRLSPAVRLSEYFMPTLRETPSEAEIVSHRLMLRAGMVRQESAGIYSWLPLGFRVLKKIEQIVREEMDRRKFTEVDATRHIIDRDRGDKISKEKPNRKL